MGKIVFVAFTVALILACACGPVREEAAGSMLAESPVMQGPRWENYGRFKYAGKSGAWRIAKTGEIRKVGLVRFTGPSRCAPRFTDGWVEVAAQTKSAAKAGLVVADHRDDGKTTVTTYRVDAAGAVDVSAFVFDTVTRGKCFQVDVATAAPSLPGEVEGEDQGGGVEDDRRDDRPGLAPKKP